MEIIIKQTVKELFHAAFDIERINYVIDKI